jgi:predicted small secreted protein
LVSKEESLTLKALIALGCAAAVLAGCNTVSRFREGRDLTPAKAPAAAKDCSKGGLGCPPTDRRQYYDQRSARYYYFDPSTGRYYWENGDPRF